MILQISVQDGAPGQLVCDSTFTCQENGCVGISINLKTDMQFHETQIQEIPHAI